MNEKINLQDLSVLLAEKAAITKKDAETFLREYFEIMNEKLIEDKSLKIKDLGTFKLLSVEDRESIDVTTGERVLIPAHFKISFTSDKKLAETINEPFAFFETIEIDNDFELEGKNLLSDDDGEEESGEMEEMEKMGENEEKEDDGEEEKIKTEEPLEYFEPSEPSVPSVPPVHSEPLQPSVEINNRDYEEQQYYQEGYYKSKKKLNVLRAIMIVLSVLLLAAVGYIIYMKQFEKKLSAVVIEPLLPQQVVPKDSVALVGDSIAQAEEPVKQDTVEKTVSSAPVSDSTPTSTSSVSSASISSARSLSAHAGKPKQITIRAGQRLTSIALEEYGDRAFWIYIYLENKAKLSNPNVLPLGVKITIPPADKYGINRNDSASIQRAREIAAKYL